MGVVVVVRRRQMVESRELRSSNGLRLDVTRFTLSEMIF